MHDARKTGKQLRYATEVARPAVGADARGFAKQLKKVQSILGDHQDAMVSAAFLRSLGGQVGISASQNGFTYGLLLGRAEARAAEADRLFAGRWPALAERFGG